MRWLGMKYVLLGVLFASLLIAGCVQQGQPQATATPTVAPTAAPTATPTPAPKPIKIGSLSPLTGDVANLGIGQRNGVELAVEGINAKDGVGGSKLEVVYEDGKCAGKEATTAAQKLVNVDKVFAIVGGLCSSETLAASKITDAAKVIMISPCSSNPSVTDAGDYVFRDYPSDSFQGKVAAEHAYNDWKAKKAAVLYENKDYPLGLANTFEARFKELGGEVVAKEAADPEPKDLRPQLTKIKAASPDLVYLIAYTQGTSVGLQQAAELGITAKILGGDSADDPKILEAAKQAAEGFVWSVPKVPESSEYDAFKQAYKKKYDGDPLLCGAQAYDAVNILAWAIGRAGGTDAGKVKDALYSLKAYKGASGTIEFDKNGDLLSATYEFKAIRNQTIAAE